MFPDFCGVLSSRSQAREALAEAAGSGGAKLADAGLAHPEDRADLLEGQAPEEVERNGDLFALGKAPNGRQQRRALLSGDRFVLCGGFFGRQEIADGRSRVVAERLVEAGEVKDLGVAAQ